MRNIHGVNVIFSPELVSAYTIDKEVNSLMKNLIFGADLVVKIQVNDFLLASDGACGGSGSVQNQTEASCMYSAAAVDVRARLESFVHANTVIEIEQVFGGVVNEGQCQNEGNLNRFFVEKGDCYSPISDNEKSGNIFMFPALNFREVNHQRDSGRSWTALPTSKHKTGLSVAHLDWR